MSPKMSLNVFQTILFDGNINYVSSLQWSADNKIALSTDKGIYIMTSYCCPTEPGCPLTFHKQFIPPPQETLAFNLFESREKLHMHLDKGDLHALMLDHTLSPKTANAPNYLVHKSVMWAPLGSAGYRRCLLAVLTLDHRLTIYQELKDKWEELSDISTILYNKNKDEWRETVIAVNSLALAKKQFATLKERAYSLATVEIAWTQLFDIDGGDAEKWCYLVAAMKNGHINFWRIQVVPQLKVELAVEWNSKFGIAKCLYWQNVSSTSGFLIVGLLDGLVYAIQVSEVSHSTNGSELQISEHFMLWNDEDNIPVDKIVSLKKNRSTYLVVCAKMNFLIGCSVTFENKKPLVKSSHYTAGQHCLAATGMCLVPKGSQQSQLLLSSLDGHVFEIDVTETDDQGIIFQQKEIKLPVSGDKMVPRGVASSPNGIMHAALYNFGCMFDHLVIREPIKLLIFTTASFQTVSELIVRPTRGCMPVPFCSNYADIIDAMRGHLSLGEALPSVLEKVLTLDIQQQSVYTLQLVRYLLKTASSESFPLNLKISYSDNRLREVEKQLMKKHCLNVCFLAATRQDRLNRQQKLSFGLMSDWLSSSCDVVVAEADEDWDTDEQCPVCDLNILFEDCRRAGCTQAHRFARCCHSLRLIGSTGYSKCPSCRTLALTDNIWSLKPHCIYCGCLMKAVT